MRIWLPALRAGTGTDVFTERLAAGLARVGAEPVLQWFPLRNEAWPLALRRAPVPDGVACTICNLRSAWGFARPQLPLVAVKHDAVGDPASADTRTWRQRLYNRLLVQRWEALGARLASALVAVGPAAEAALREGYGRAPTHRIVNGVDTAIFAPAQPRNPPLSAPLRLLFVGKPGHAKGGDLLLPILAALGPGFELAHTGVAGVLPGWQQAPDALRDRVRALGSLDQSGMVAAYRQADLLLFPTRSEGAPYAALEAMACGLAMVASDIPALRALVQDGQEAVLCPRADVNAFVAAVRALAADPARRLALAQAARRRVVRDFDLCVQAQAYQALVSSLVTPA